jgi:hypothetical protein
LILPIRFSSLTVANYAGTDDNFVIAANNAIVGNLRGTTLKLCSYNTTNRVCVPTDPHTLTSGDVVDFTVGLAPAQNVRFYYAMFGSGLEG